MLIPLTDNETFPSKETVDTYSWPVDKDGNSQYYTETPLEKCPPVDTANDGPTKPEPDSPQSTPGDEPQSTPVEHEPKPNPADEPQSQPVDEKPQVNTPGDKPQSTPTNDVPQSTPVGDSPQSAKTPVKVENKADTPQSSNGAKGKTNSLAETGAETGGLIAAAVSSLLAGAFLTRAASRKRG